ncbi:hypothetical protein [Streptomyces sp. NBC_00842]|nr:hypothetical protein OH821_35005 [Streptomyces sp. NBC_00842]
MIEKNLAHFHAADADYGKRVEEAVRALREDWGLSSGSGWITPRAQP